MKKHTSAPWGIGGKHPYIIARVISSDHKDIVITGGIPSGGGPFEAALSREEQHDNALLIAAAPELLALCQAYERWDAKIIRSDEAWDTNDGLPCMTNEVYNRWIELQEQRNEVLAKL